ncbi:MAG: hypothetical protein ABH816_01850 [Candidatus Levyibacteriota bacterium]
MDDSQNSKLKTQNSNQQGGLVNQTANQSLVSNPSTVTEPVSPVSVPQKEIVEPVLNQPIASEIQEEWVKPSQAEPEIQPEVEEAGVEKVSELPRITEEHKQVGIEHAKESTPVQTKPSGTIQLPMTEKEADSQIKSTKNTDSPHWLAVLIKKIFKRLKGTN